MAIKVSLGTLTRIKSLVGLLHLLSTKETDAKTERKMRDFANEIDELGNQMRRVIYRLEAYLEKQDLI